MQEFKLLGATGLSALQKQAQNLLKATPQISPRQINWKAVHQGILGKGESILGYFNYFEQTFQQDSGTKEP